MSTRGRVGIVVADGSVKSIYNHFDAYPKYLGRMLLSNYTNREKVESLMNLGDCSYICEQVEIPAGKTHSFSCPLDGVTVAYGRDRGEEGCDAVVSADERTFWRGDIEEYGYLFRDGKWFVATSHGFGKSNGEWVSVAPNDRKVIELTDAVCADDTDSYFRISA